MNKMTSKLDTRPVCLKSSPVAKPNIFFSNKHLKFKKLYHFIGSQQLKIPIILKRNNYPLIKEIIPKFGENKIIKHGKDQEEL